jgi:polysaccharide biosynthesis protein PslJ
VNSFASNIAWRSRLSLANGWRAFGLVVLISVLVGLGVEFAFLYTLGVFLAVFVIATLLFAPVAFLPLLAFSTFCLIPVNDLPLPEVFRAASFGVVVLGVWLLRRGPRQRARASAFTRYSAYLLVLCLLMTSIFTISLSRSIVWSVAFIASVLLPIFAGGFSDRESRLIITGLITLATGLSCFAILEYAIRENPLFGHLYSEAPYPLIQHWSTYRVTTTLGHPLNNALVFAAAAAAAFAAYLETKRARLLVAFALTLVGLFLTGSRGALYLTPVVIVVVMTVYVRSHRLQLHGFGRLLLLVAAGAGIAGALYTQTVGARAETGEARSSTNVRYEDVRVAIDRAKQLDFLGSGPGTSNSARAENAESISNSSLVIENSYLQLLVSIGIPGVVLVIVFFGAVVREGVRRQRLPAAAAFLSTVLVISTYNFIEGVRPGLILLGLLGGACLVRANSDTVVGARAKQQPRT